MTRVIGLTGNIASGKSTVAALMAGRGAAIIDADQLARAAVEPGAPALGRIAERWPSVIDSRGALDRNALRQIVFTDPIARAELDAIVHPAVAALRDAALRDARERGTAIVVYDVPLLFEAGLQEGFDAIILVDAPADVRRERLVRDRGLSPTEADAMIAAQMPAGAKRARSDFIIDNAGDRTALAARVGTVWDALARGDTRG